MNRDRLRRLWTKANIGAETREIRSGVIEGAWRPLEISKADGVASHEARLGKSVLPRTEMLASQVRAFNRHPLAVMELREFAGKATVHTTI